MKTQKRTLLVYLLLFIVPHCAFAHKGSPWHGNGLSAAVGLNTLYLELPPGKQEATFRFRYPIQRNSVDYTVGNTSTLMVVSDEALKTDGFITESNALFARESDSYDPSSPLTVEAVVKKSGYYHVLFGPGPNTSILVLEPSLTVSVDPLTEGAKVGKFLAPATAGDFHIVKDPAQGIKRFAGWFAVFFEEYAPLYSKNNLQTAKTLSLQGDRAVSFANALAERGYPQFKDFQKPDSAMVAPFLGHINGLGVEASDTALLEKGEYEYIYTPSVSKASIVRSREIVMQVVPDTAYSKGYITEADVIARSEIQNDRNEFKLRFAVENKGLYHLSYGPGDGGFIFHLVPDKSLPTALMKVSGESENIEHLVAVNSVIIGPKPMGLNGSWQVCFPCKVVPEKAAALSALKGTQVPLSDITAANVSRFGTSIMHPIMMRYMRIQLDAQSKKLQLLEEKK